jgi:hypothetical protein
MFILHQCRALVQQHKRQYADDKAAIAASLALYQHGMAAQCQQSIQQMHQKTVEVFRRLNLDLETSHGETVVKAQLAARLENEVSRLSATLLETTQKYEALQEAHSMMQQESQSTSRRDTACEPMSPLMNRISRDADHVRQLSDRDDQIGLLKGQVQAKRDEIMVLRSRMQSAGKYLCTLEEKYAQELHAVKHNAHVKDLLRTAATREASLEKDRLLSEIKHCK